ncbi:MAG TPA: GGDEF domain-containing protein [Vicinamibacteria bacterium]|nr:GGDEF domain-containing protein [Vicinamibacteria bacterium]
MVLALVLAAVLGALLLLYAWRAFTAQEKDLVEMRRQVDSAARDCTVQRREADRAQQDRQFLLHFLRDFPHVTRELHAGLREREVPSLLLRVVERTFEPRGVVVYVRRRAAEGSPERAGRLVAAAVAPETSPVGVGDEAALGAGEVGYAAEVQRVLSRHDFESVPATARMTLRAGRVPGFDPDFVAPMVCGEETLGAIAIVGSARTGEDARAVLRLVAEAGAKALRDAATYAQMRISADLDGLTGILNKREATRALSEQTLAAEGESEPLSVFLFDIDNFKHYNDANGHLAGDGLLRDLARLVKQHIRRDDVFGRFGGEEFLLVLPRTGQAQALAVADKVRAVIAAHPFPFAGAQPLGHLSVSGGVAEFPVDGQDSAALLRAADHALYEAKAKGRDRVLAVDRSFLSDESAAARAG